MGNVVTNVYAKSNYDRLRIDKALGTFANLTTTSRQTETFAAIRDPFPGPKIYNNYHISAIFSLILVDFYDLKNVQFKSSLCLSVKT